MASLTTLDPSKRSDRIVQELITGSIADLTPAAKIAPKPKSNDGCSVERLQKVVDRHWELMPKPTHALLLGRTPVNLQTLTNFWSQPQWRDFTRGNVAASMSGTSWLLSLTYLRLGQIKEARSLLLNGSFIRQCGDTPVERIAKINEEKIRLIKLKDLPNSLKSRAMLVDRMNLPLYTEAFDSLETPETMESFLLKMLPYRCQHMLGSPINNNSYNVNQYVNQIGNSWASNSSTKKKRTPSSQSVSTETHIRLILECNGNGGERHTLSIGSSTTLKSLFNDYAKERGDSLRSLRFSYRGKALFLSSVGKKTPEQMDMKDQDVIIVHFTGASRETADVGDSEKRIGTPAPQKSLTTQNQKTKNKKTKGKKKKTINHKQPVKTSQEWKREHSNRISKVHEEVHQRLREIRIRLNALDVKCQSKKKRKNRRKSKVGCAVDKPQILPQSGIGGKAGKSSFSVQVGEIQNLYKTTNKPPQNVSRHNATALLDMHGYTREEALLKLDESLPIWVDSAMRGSYPFVMPVRIVCGGGHQILSETVEKWIRDHAQVANAIQNTPQ